MRSPRKNKLSRASITLVVIQGLLESELAVTARYLPGTRGKKAISILEVGGNPQIIHLKEIKGSQVGTENSICTMHWAGIEPGTAEGKGEDRTTRPR